MVVWVCGCIGSCFCGCMGLWLYRFVFLWLYGFVGFFVCVCMCWSLCVWMFVVSVMMFCVGNVRLGAVVFGHYEIRILHHRIHYAQFSHHSMRGPIQ